MVPNSPNPYFKQAVYEPLAVDCAPVAAASAALLSAAVGSPPAVVASCSAAVGAYATSAEEGRLLDEEAVGYEADVEGCWVEAAVCPVLFPDDEVLGPDGEVEPEVPGCADANSAGDPLDFAPVDPDEACDACSAAASSAAATAD